MATTEAHLVPPGAELHAQTRRQPAGGRARDARDWGTTAGLRGGQGCESGAPGHRPAAQNGLIVGAGDDKQGQEKGKL